MAPPETTGRASGEIARAHPRAKPRGPAVVGEPSRTISEFCQHEKISRAKYYELRKAGKAPAETRIDGLIRITPQSHAEWRRRFTASTKGAAAS
jgi:hypothetical protein